MGSENTPGRIVLKPLGDKLILAKQQLLKLIQTEETKHIGSRLGEELIFIQAIAKRVKSSNFFVVCFVTVRWYFMKYSLNLHVLQSAVWQTLGLNP